MKKDYEAIAIAHDKALKEQKKREKQAIKIYVKIDNCKDEYYWVFYKDHNEQYTISKINGVSDITTNKDKIETIKFDRIENILKYKEVIKK